MAFKPARGLGKAIGGWGLAWSAWGQGANYDQPLDRPFTLRDAPPARLEAETDRLIREGGALSFAYPRPCLSPLDSSRVCPEDFRLRYRGADGELAARPLAAADFRRGSPGYPDYHEPGEGVNATAGEAGLVLAGGKGPVAFYTDARLFMEEIGTGGNVAYDREAVDAQTRERSALEYNSFARYRANLSLDLPFGRLVAARDALHWGPGLFTNLTFQQDAPPFNQFRYSASVGPLSVTSVYGDLLGVSGDYAPKNLYAHRYELRLGRDWLLGLSDLLILHREDKPYFFIPVFPLFIAKTSMYETDNNGLLAADLAYRLRGLGLVYAEFLLDDLESPSSLLTRDYRENKWGWRAGAQAAHTFGGWPCGLVAEYSRVEPWVYTHFPDYPAQASNGDYPLGDPFGPNSRNLVLKAFARRGNLYVSLRGDWMWKGSDSGSRVTDSYAERDNLLPKRFLQGVDHPDFRLTPFAGYAWRWLYAEAGVEIQSRPAALARFQAAY